MVATKALNAPGAAWVRDEPRPRAIGLGRAACLALAWALGLDLPGLLPPGAGRAGACALDLGVAGVLGGDLCCVFFCDPAERRDFVERAMRILQSLCLGQKAGEVVGAGWKSHEIEHGVGDMAQGWPVYGG